MAAVATAATLAAGLALMRGLLSLRSDPVADAADGLDPDPGARELGAQPGQVDVDGVRAERVGLVVPDVLGDRVPVSVGRSPWTSTSRAAGSNSSSPIFIRGDWLTGGLRCSALSRASSSPKSNGLTR